MWKFDCRKCHGMCSGCKSETLSGLDKTKIVLVGNPNVGKSVIFGAISGFYVEVSNYPGTTVDVAKADTNWGQIIDTPGVYSLGTASDDERVTLETLKDADMAVNIIGAASLDRDLFLTQQLIDLGIPLIVVVNQIDEAEKFGVRVDCEKLASALGVKVIPAVATKKQGIFDIVKAIAAKEAAVSPYKTPYTREKLGRLKDKDEIRKALMTAEAPETDNAEEKMMIYRQRTENVDRLLREICTREEKRETFGEKLGNWLLNPFIGGLTAVLMLYLLFELLGVLVAGNVVDCIFTLLDEKYVPWITAVTDAWFSSAAVREILSGEFGVLTMSVKIVVAVLLPLIAAFYLFVALLEDSGYLPRLAVLTDNVLSKIGLNGRAVIPLLLGFGCGAMGTISTRILGTARERTIVTAILGITVPCAAQQGIIIALLAAIGGIKVWFAYIGIIFAIMVVSGTVLNKMLKGKSSDLLIDLPPLRLPQLKNTFEKTCFRVVNFMSEAVPLFVVSSVLITLLNMVGFLSWLQNFLEPVVVNVLHLPAQFSDIFVMGLIRRDFASVGILDMAGMDNSLCVLDNLQILTATVVVTLFVPCIAALIVIFKERGWKEAALLWLGTFAISVGIGGIVARTFGFLF